MGELRDHDALSRVELIVLARLSGRAVTKAELVKSLRTVGIPFKGLELEDCATATLAALVSQGLVSDPSPGTAAHPPTPLRGKGHKQSKSGKPRFALTEAGRVMLRSSFGLKKTPSWNETRDRVVPILALGELPGEAAADAALRKAEGMMATWLRRDRTLGAAITIAQLCDQVIARALGMPPGPVTLAGMRGYALARHCGVDSKADFEHIASMFEPPRSARSKKSQGFDDKLKRFAADLVRKELGAGITQKKKMSRQLVRHWVSQQDEADGAQRLSVSWPTSLRAMPMASTASPATLTPPPITAGFDPLLTAVQDAIPRVGSDGRYGKENVFVSALWRQLARDQRLADLSLGDFKQWLVSANRDQLLALARADLVDDMDARLVEDSEIEDLGETFHFVIDHRGSLSASGQMLYAR